MNTVKELHVLHPWWCRPGRHGLLLAVSACASPEPPAETHDARSELLAADRAFAKSTEANGLEGWMSFFADDAVRLVMGAEAIQGLPAVREYDSRLFADTTLKLEWDPTDAGVFSDGRHGFTTGRYSLLSVSSAAYDTLQKGAYVTIWRRNEQGVWQVILDTGS